MKTTTKFHPILFSTPMVQAIQENRKTQTRRIVKLPKYHPSRTEKQHNVMTIKDWILYDGNNESIGTMKCPYNVGDVLWVRESFHYIHDSENNDFLRYGYKADNDYLGAKWKPSIHMQKAACRIFLKIKSIKIERLRDISEEDAIAEGILKRNYEGSVEFKNYLDRGASDTEFWKTSYTVPVYSFRSLWRKINGLESWDFNPFVWVYEFERIEKPEDFI